MDGTNTDIIEKIENLKKQKNAVILAHNYQLGEVQDVADLVGDAFEMTKKAVESDADVIIVGGVTCIAETIAIACPEKTVILPDLDAGCTLANMITAERLLIKKEKYPEATILCYINSPAEVKAESDICYAEEDAVSIVEQMPEDKEIMYIPDQYLGDFVATKTERELLLWPGYCSPLVKIRPEDVSKMKEEYPQAKVVVQLQCIPQVKAMADAILGTAGIVDYVRETDAKEFIICAEIGIIHRLEKENPDKTIIPASELAKCATMKITTLENIMWALENLSPQIEIEEEIKRKAKPPVDKMLGR
ncbi:quinolinate synthase NadA [Chloroflexota bacterium]